MKGRTVLYGTLVMLGLTLFAAGYITLIGPVTP